jgi:hypothetical protein
MTSIMLMYNFVSGSYLKMVYDFDIEKNEL